MQLDGPDLEELLVRARHEYGADVRIVKADKVRSGGVGGFFTREHYELSIEVDEPVIPEAPARAPESTGRPASLLDLADAISDREIQSRTTAARPPAPRAPAPQDEPLDFTPGIPPVAQDIPAGPALSTDSQSFASILASLSQTVAEKAPAPSETRPPSSSGQGRTGHDVEQQRGAEAVVATRPSMSEPEVRRPPARKSPQRAGRVPKAEISLRDLRDLGMPRAMLPAREGGDLLEALVSALRCLPAPPQVPTGGGDILAVVGEGDGAWDAAVSVARSINLDERALAYLTAGAAPTKVAPARRVTSLDQLQARVERWRKRTTPTVAVVDAPMSVKAAQWNRQALNCLSAQAVWLVVPATRKTDDVASWASRIGKGDGIVVTDVDASSDPASVLRLGLPVAWLDGRPATPGAWAGLLVDRLVGAR